MDFFGGLLSMLNPMTVPRQIKSIIENPKDAFSLKNATGLGFGRKVKGQNNYDARYDEKRPPAAVTNYRLGLGGVAPPPQSSGPIEDAMLMRQQRPPGTMHGVSSLSTLI